MKKVYCILFTSLFLAACNDNPADPEQAEEIDFFMEATIDGQQNRWMNTDDTRPLISHRTSYNGTASSDYQIGFKSPDKEYTGPATGQTYNGQQKLIIRFPEAVEQQENGLSSYLEEPDSYNFNAIAPGSTPKFKAYFYYSDLGWYNISNTKLTDLRWQFENQLLSGPNLDQQTESNDHTYAYTYEGSLNNQVQYEMYDDGNLLHRNQLYVDFSDASKKFSVRLSPREDSLFAITRGTGPFRYEWNTGSDETFILPEGNETTQYSVAVTDQFGQTATATATYFFGSNSNENGTPIFASIGAWIKNLSWKLIADDKPGEDLEFIYINDEGSIFYSKLAAQNEASRFDIQTTTSFTYRGTCIDLPCPEYRLGGTAIAFEFSAVLASPGGQQIEITNGKGLMPLYLERTL